MDIKTITERSQALQLEFILLKKEMKNYANANPAKIDAVDDAYRYKANNYPGDITPARIARVSNKILYPD